MNEVGSAAWTMPLSIDSYAISWEANQRRHKIYFSSAGAPEACVRGVKNGRFTLYTCEDLQRGGEYYGIDKQYEYHQSSGGAAELIYFVRSVAHRVFEFFVPTELFNGQLRERDPISQLLYLTNTALVWTCAVILGPALILTEAVVIGAFAEIFDRALNHQGTTNPMGSYFPLSSALPHITIGAVCFLPTFFVANGVGSALCAAMEHLGIYFFPVQDVQRVIAPSWPGMLVALYVMIGAPFLEEVLFRGILQDFFHSLDSESQDKIESEGVFDRVKSWLSSAKEKPEETKVLNMTWSQWKTALKVSLIFGLAHASVSQGWFNVPVVVVTGLIGLVMSILREVTGDLWAPMTLHALNNTIGVMQLFGVLPLALVGKNQTIRYGVHG